MAQSRKLMGVAAAVILLPAALAAAGCGGSSTSSTTTASPPTSSAAGTTTATATGSTTPATTTTALGQTTAAAAAATQTIRVDVDPTGNLAFTQKTLSAKAGTIKFVLHNQSSLRHNLAISGNGATFGPSETISGGQTADLVATLKPGTYEFYCAVPGHKDAGMQGTLTVT